MRFKGLLAAALLLTQGYAWGECHFGSRGEGGTSTIVNTQAGVPVYFHPVPQGQFPSDGIEIGGPYEATLSPGLWSACDAGNDGEYMSNITYDAIGGVDGAMWETNVPGIYYAVRIYSPSGNEGAWFQATFGQWANLSTDASTPKQDWKAQIKLVQTAGFVGNVNNAAFITPKEAKKIGGMAIGNHTDSDNQPWWFEVTPSTFSIPIASATCQAITANNGTNNVDFGEIMYSTMRDGYYPYKEFNLELNCSNVVAIEYKMSSNKVSSGSQDPLLLNTLTSNAAAGIGVEIIQEFHANPSGGTLPFTNSPDYIFVPLPNAGTSASNALPFLAYLYKDGTPLKAGNFRAVATFTINYL
ncbi:fimbrial protein [Enterobacter sp. C6]|uniref:fimbrial protein n=1 Tax=Enterobacter sp. C6 TaxID=1299469 RepID=UPI0011E64230|nr:fimbrial protein [Enterobacter sp. C6]KAE8273036.1 fimbrial protein [Enterobacter sp. C6]